MTDARTREITVHLRFKSADGLAPPVTIRDVHAWLAESAGVASLSNRCGAPTEVMISDGHCTEIIDLDGAYPDDATMIV